MYAVCYSTKSCCIIVLLCCQDAMLGQFCIATEDASGKPSQVTIYCRSKKNFIKSAGIFAHDLLFTYIVMICCLFVFFFFANLLFVFMVNDRLHV